MLPVNSLNKIIKISNLRVVNNNYILLRLNSNRLKKMWLSSSSVDSMIIMVV